MRIERLAVENRRTQGPARRAWYRRRSLQHLRAVTALVEHALWLGGRAPGDGLGACPAPVPPPVASLQPGGYDLVISDLILTQLYSLPLLDVVDTLTAYAPAVADLRETLPRYRDAANAFRQRVAL